MAVPTPAPPGGPGMARLAGDMGDVQSTEGPPARRPRGGAVGDGLAPWPGANRPGGAALPCRLPLSDNSAVGHTRIDRVAASMVHRRVGRPSRPAGHLGPTIRDSDTHTRATVGAPPAWRFAGPSREGEWHSPQSSFTAPAGVHRPGLLSPQRGPLRIERVRRPGAVGRVARRRRRGPRAQGEARRIAAARRPETAAGARPAWSSP